MKACIEATVKKMYHRRIMFRALDNMKTGAKRVYNIDKRTTMRWVKQEYYALVSKAVLYC